MERLDRLNKILEEVLDDYGWAPDVLFTDPNSVDEYKKLYIDEYSKKYVNNTMYLVESVNAIISRVNNV